MRTALVCLVWLWGCTIRGGDSGDVFVDRDLDGFPELTDCDDEDPSAYPGAAEVCDGVDNDCDEEVDEIDGEAGGGTEWFRDQDGDGYGDPDAVAEGCSAPSGYVADDSDCDDTSEHAYPLAGEVCDGLDNDCDGLTDDDDPSVDPDGMQTWHADDDGDGYGDDARTRRACEAPSGYTADGGDCDDDDDDTNPSAAEVCDGLDNDCDGLTDDDDSDLDGCPS